MTLRYGSVCSGIEAATVAWEPLGWKPAWFCEIDPFPSAVLAHHYPEIPNHGDFTRLCEPTHAVHGGLPVDLLVGGTPCQAFSLAGLRGGYSDPRGRLTLEFLRLAQALRPRWVVWENVPGVLSQDGGRAFGAFLRGLEEVGYGWAYRVVDAQYARVDGYPRAVPQRRRRVFVVGRAGDGWQRAAAALLEPESMRGDPPTRGKAEKDPATAAGRGSPSGGLDQPICGALTAGFGKMGAPEIDAYTAIPVDGVAVRRLTPRECERLQGFPDDYTAIPQRGKPAADCPDGPRYKALGNSMAVNVMRWIGRRIELVESLS